MKLECLIYEKEEDIAIITLNRPQVLNAMNVQTWMEFKTVLQEVKNDEQIKGVIITGTGRAFSSGADLKESKKRSLNEYREYLIQLQEISKQLIGFPKPTVAAINGYAIGGGVELCLACDIRIAGDSAKFSFPEAKVSSSGTGGVMRLLQDIVGLGKAKELLFTCEMISSREAERIGLVNKVVSDVQLMEEAKIMIEEITKHSLHSINVIKKGLNLAREVSLDALMEYEIEACLDTVTTPERQKKLADFNARKNNEE
ncbi:MAG: enoyl-CoA hydratase/isomerase family protein [Candidatus Hodarchaeales archaeon]|jgi:enoyl-CoA hydratase